MLLPDSKTELVRRGNKVVYDLGDKIVKVFNETKPVSDVFNEALNLARINECGIRSPKALEVSQLENANGWALVTEKVPGTTLAEKMTAEPQRFGEYLEMFVDLQIEIHGYTSPLLNRQRDKFARMIDSLDQLNATTRYNLQERLDGMTKEFKVCHGDFNPSNVIVGDDGQLYVCDWAHATQGSPAADVATTYLLFALNSKDQAEAYLELYCDRADMPMQVVRQWTSIVAASELARKRNVNDEFLKNWIDVVDGQLYVCDWAHATQGSPAADVATTYLLFALNSKDQAEAYLELYCDRADMPMQVVRQWTSIVAASELARKRNVNDEFLKNWIDVVDYQ